MEFLRIAEALDITDKKLPNGDRLPFDIEFVTCDVRRRTGGEIVNLKNVTRCGLPHDQLQNGTIGIRNKENSHHPICVHNVLILSINGKEVLL